MRGSGVLVLALLATSAHAQEDDRPQLQRMRFVERGQTLTATCLPPSCSFAKLFDSQAYEALNSGFTSTILISFAVYPRDGRVPVAVEAVVYTLFYDLWDEQYTIRIESSGAKRTRKVRYKSEALKIITGFEDVAIARLVNIPYQDIFYVQLSVQLNPVSKETLAEVRRWLSQGTGGGLDRGGVYFGSFVSVFVNPKIAQADRALRMRSQPFYRPRP